jgi:hypothetical protein
MSIDPLLEGLSVYQDVVLDGRCVRRGHRDCPGRWELIAEHLPRAGSILDVGSNFGWFGLQIAQSRPDCVVASLEADLRSAEVQRRVLQANGCQRVCLLTARAGVSVVKRMAAAGQRFDGVLCLSVLHWMADHRPFLAELGKIAGRILIEQPDPREEGAGVESIRRAIGPIGHYLAGLFSDRPVRRLAQLPSHRGTEHPRELWLVAEPSDWPSEPSPGLDVQALLGCSPGWPPRSWWLESLPPISRGKAEVRQGRPLFTPAGLHGDPARAIRRRLKRLPEHAAFSPPRRLVLRVRRSLGNLLRRVIPS